MDTDAVRADLGSGAPAPDSLACVTCRSRKLKCDRVKPVCTRCTKAKADCVYPESRRKPAFKRRNVKELEERLAQVEGLLREGRMPGDGGWNVGTGDSSAFPLGSLNDFTVDMETLMARETSYSNGNTAGNGAVPGLPHNGNGFHAAAPSFPGTAESPNELMGLGLNEQLPPFELMEELNAAYFAKAHMFMPIIHPSRYFQFFYSAPHKRPPMCLQYAMWTLASSGHEKYSHYHDIFYKRARQYADGDEMRGYGEHFLSVAHAQAWALIATDEARSMLFTRAAISSAKAVRLVEMMGLHRIDGGGHEMAPTLAPPRDWIDLEERRRTFWGAFAIDCHASISTGWPTLVNPDDINTNLPSSEEAFNEGREETTCALPEAFKGSPYSTFAGSIIICHVHNEILRHIHRVKSTDQPQDVEHGEFWKRHRRLDNILLSAFMFLPESFQLPRGLRNPAAVHTNLNLHAGVICLHHAAIEKIQLYKLPDPLKRASELRLRGAAEEIVNIVRLSSHINSGFKSPLAALSMYCASSVYVYVAKSNPHIGLSSKETGDLEFLIQAMEAIGRHHLITQAFLQQVCADIERNGLSSIITLPSLAKYRNAFGWQSSNVPLLARSYLTKHSEIQTPLPGRLPLGLAKGTYDPSQTPQAQRSRGCTGGSSDDDQLNEATNKRKRASPSSNPASVPGDGAPSFDREPSRAKPPYTAQPQGVFGGGLLRATGMTSMNRNAPIDLPHRTGSATGSSSIPTTGINSHQTSNITTPIGGVDMRAAADTVPYSSSAVQPVSASFDPANNFMYSQVPPSVQGVDSLVTMGFDTSSGVVDPWAFMENMDETGWNGLGRGQGAGPAN